MASNIYFISQDTEHLFGEFVVNAVVIAESADRARSVLKSHVRAMHKETNEYIRCDTSLLSIRKIGNNGKLPDMPTRTRPGVVCLNIGEDNALPSGNYNYINKVGQYMCIEND